MRDEPVGTPILPRQLSKDAAPCYQRLLSHINLAGKYGQRMPLDGGQAHTDLHTEVFGETGWPDQFLVAQAVHDVAMWLLTDRIGQIANLAMLDAQPPTLLATVDSLASSKLVRQPAEGRTAGPVGELRPGRLAT